MNWIIGNSSTQRQMRWSQVAVDYNEDRASGMPDFCSVGDQGWLAHRGEAIGKHTRLWYVLTDLAGSQSVSITSWHHLGTSAPPFILSKWISDRLGALLPTAVITLQNGETISVTCQQALLSSDHPARKRFTLRGFQKGWALTAFATIWWGQDVIDLVGYITWSDRSVPDELIENVTISLKFGESNDEFYPVHAPKCGAQMVDAHTWQLHYGRVADSFGIPFRGVLIARSDTGEQDANRVSFGNAAKFGNVYGVSRGFIDNNSWLAFGAVNSHSWAFTSGLLQSFRDRINTPGQITDAKVFSNVLNTGDTGFQNCFGAQKGLQFLFEPKAIGALLESAEDYVLRSIFNLNEGGGPITAASHPNWETWGAVTEVNSRDTLGKDTKHLRPWGWDRINGRYITIDEQHRGDGFIFAAYALTGDPLFKDQILSLLEIDVARAKQHRNALDAPRSSGRLWQSWAKMAILFSDNSDALQKIKSISSKELTLRIQDLDAISGPVKWPQVVHDDRVLPGLDAAVPWNIALMVLGGLEQYYTWNKLDDYTLSDQFIEYVKTVSKTLLQWGTVRGSDGILRPLNGVQVLAGNEPNPPAYYTWPREHASTGPDPGTDMLVGTGGWWWWWAGVIKVGYTYLDSRSPEFLKAQEIKESVFSNPSDINEAEWWSL